MKTKLMTVTVITAALLGASFATVAENAETQITALQLPVMINQTGTYVDAQTNMLVYPGDRLMAMSGGSVTVVYANGCAQSVSSNEIVQVGTPESCNALVEAGTNFALGDEGADATETTGTKPTDPVEKVDGVTKSVSTQKVAGSAMGKLAVVAAAATASIAAGDTQNDCISSETADGCSTSI